MTESSVIRNEITQRPDWHKLVVRADEWVRQSLRQWQSGKNIEWRVRETPGSEPRFLFTIRANGNQVEGEFSEVEIADRDAVRRKVVPLWGELIDKGVQQTFESLHQLLVDWRSEAREEEVASGHAN